MRLASLCDFELKPWEERMLASAIIQEAELPKQAFSPEMAARLRRAEQMLKEIPAAWLRQISREVLKKC